MSESKPAAMLKPRTLPWLVAALVLDVLLLALATFPQAMTRLTPEAALSWRGALAALLPLPALVLTAIPSGRWKYVLVFWRWRDPLPACRAFSVHALADPRIDLDQLRRHVGTFPAEPRAQNTRWYALYKDVESEPSVAESQRSFLLFRDLATLSALLLLVVPALFWWWVHNAAGAKASALLFLVQYLGAALAARATAIRFVRNVLAIHSARKVARAAPRKARAPQGKP
jgi:hypothetical protein